MESKVRNSNLELLRIIAMLMIISYHAVVHGGFDSKIEKLWSKIWFEEFSLWGKAGVNMFCLLMGYFGCSRTFSLKRLLKVELKTVLYSCLGLLIAIIAQIPLAVTEILKSVFPVIFDHYWFITAWVAVYCISPVLNWYICNAERKSFLKTMMVTLLLWSVIPFFTLQQNSGMGFTQFIWFVIMYLMGGYIYLNEPRYPYICYYRMIVITGALQVLLCVVLNIFGYWFSDLLYNNTSYIRWSNNPIIVVFSFCMLRTFSMKASGDCRIINWLAKGALGIYLLHENIFIQKILWNKVNSIQVGEHFSFILLSFVVIICIYIIGSTFDFLVDVVFAKPNAFIETNLQKGFDAINKRMDDLFE